MFIRRTQVQKKKNGGHYYTCRIVESRRVGDKVSQQILLNLGADFSIPKELWPALTRRIEEILHGQDSLAVIDSDIDKWARNYAARIIASRHDQNSDNDKSPDYREIDIDSLEMNRAKSVGCEHVTLEALRRLEIDNKLMELGFARPQMALAVGTIIGRAYHPASERETHRWLQGTVRSQRVA